MTPTPSSTVPADQLRPLTEPERRVVRLLQGHVRPCADLFAQMATEVGMGTAELLAVLRALQDCGRLKRVGLVLRHRSAGYAANAMCAWRIAPDRTEHAGRGLAASPFVTHCYERAPSPQIPFNLYAMMHAHTWREFRTGYGRAVEHLGLDRGVLLCSLREFKKTSPIYA